MADRTWLFDELVSEPRLRSKVYEVEETRDKALACIELTARRGQDWHFARVWVDVRGTRRHLYRRIDDCERAGWRFAVASGIGTPAESGQGDNGIRASEFVRSLPPDEKEVYRELFPTETSLLASGYDWDRRHVWRDGAEVAPDVHGRLLEAAQGVLWEWLRVDEEFTWRRYPLEVLRSPQAPSVNEEAATAESAA